MVSWLSFVEVAESILRAFTSPYQHDDAFLCSLCAFAFFAFGSAVCYLHARHLISRQYFVSPPIGVCHYSTHALIFSFNGWNFSTAPDKNYGYVSFQSQAVATSQKLVYTNAAGNAIIKV